MISYHARWSLDRLRCCSSDVFPNKCACLAHGRCFQHPRRKLAGFWAHFQRQWVFFKVPGHNGRHLGPRRVVVSGCGWAYLTSKKTTVSLNLLSLFSHTSSVICASPKILSRWRTWTPHITRASRLVCRPRHNSVPATSTQSPLRYLLVVLAVAPPPQKCLEDPSGVVAVTCQPRFHEQRNSEVLMVFGSCRWATQRAIISRTVTSTPSHKIESHVSWWRSSGTSRGHAREPYKARRPGQRFARWPIRIKFVNRTAWYVSPASMGTLVTRGCRAWSSSEASSDASPSPSSARGVYDVGT